MPLARGEVGVGALDDRVHVPRRRGAQDAERLHVVQQVARERVLLLPEGEGGVLDRGLGREGQAGVVHAERLVDQRAGAGEELLPGRPGLGQERARPAAALVDRQVAVVGLEREDRERGHEQAVAAHPRPAALPRAALAARAALHGRDHGVADLRVELAPGLPADLVHGQRAVVGGVGVLGGMVGDVRRQPRGGGVAPRGRRLAEHEAQEQARGDHAVPRPRDVPHVGRDAVVLGDRVDERPHAGPRLGPHGRPRVLGRLEGQGRPAGDARVGVGARDVAPAPVRRVLRVLEAGRGAPEHVLELGRARAGARLRQGEHADRLLVPGVARADLAVRRGGLDQPVEGPAHGRLVRPRALRPLPRAQEAEQGQARRAHLAGPGDPPRDDVVLGKERPPAVGGLVARQPVEPRAQRPVARPRRAAHAVAVPAAPRPAAAGQADGVRRRALHVADRGAQRLLERVVGVDLHQRVQVGRRDVVEGPHVLGDGGEFDVGLRDQPHLDGPRRVPLRGDRDRDERQDHEPDQVHERGEGVARRGLEEGRAAGDEPAAPLVPGRGEAVAQEPLRGRARTRRRAGGRPGSARGRRARRRRALGRGALGGREARRGGGRRRRGRWRHERPRARGRPVLTTPVTLVARVRFP